MSEVSSKATFSRAAEYVNLHKKELIDLWEKVARREVRPAKKASKDALRNHLEELLGALHLSLLKNDESDNSLELVENEFTLRLSRFC